MSIGLSLSDVSVGYGPRTVVAGATLTAEPGTVTTLIGANGSGKSTLLRAIGGLARPQAGTILLEPRDDALLAAPTDITTMRPRSLARRLSMLPQSAMAPEGLTVADLVARGRQPYQRWYRQWSPDDERHVAAALERMGIAELAGSRLDELSGGQRQLAWISMCLAQDTPVIVLDEPTTYLDLAHSVEILSTVRGLARELGRTVLMVLHDLGLAARYSDRLAVLSNGELRAAGVPAEVLTPALLREAFDLDARVFPDPVDGIPTIAPAAS